MKLLTGWIISAGLVFTAAAANAQGPAPYQIAGSPYTAVSDVGGPYAEMSPEASPSRSEPGYGPMLLPPAEVYTVVRDSGFSPLGIPHQRGMFYTIAVVDRGGGDGRLVIDARNGRVVRFVPIYRIGENFYGEPMIAYGPGGLLPPIGSSVRGVLRPPASVPRVATRTPQVPLPKASPQHAGETKPDTGALAAKPPPEPAQQSAAVQAKPADAPATPPAAAPAAVEAKPAPQIQPTQEMPKAQGLF